MNMIEELYYGNIDPNMGLGKGSVEATKKVILAETALMEALEGEEKQIFLDLINAQMEVLGEHNLQHFMEGFRLGLRFGADAFQETSSLKCGLC